MPHDPLFEERIATALKTHGAKAEPKRMFGGVAFMVHGNMSLGITNKGDLMVRFDGERHDEVLAWTGAKPMTFGHKNMRGFVFVDAGAVVTKAALDKWVRLSLAYVGTLPRKEAKKKAASRRTSA
jgi:TfoX/Sxy family transcriptional regulator of competence genes